jgi:hypothetical protein
LIGGGCAPWPPSGRLPTDCHRGWTDGRTVALARRTGGMTVAVGPGGRGVLGAVGGSILSQRTVTKVTPEMLALCWRVGTINNIGAPLSRKTRTARSLEGPSK